MSESHLIGAKLRAARARFAESIEAPHHSTTLGSIVLRADQIAALRRVRTHLTRDGGCLLADEVGTGKTYVALAAARNWRAPLVVVPASLRGTWADAMQRAELRCEMVSHESLSRGATVAGAFDGIVVDESHRFRSTSRRHRVLATLAVRAPILLLSATPLQNRTRELAAQIALFLGETAYQLAASELARFVVRNGSVAPAVLPRVVPPRWLDTRADDGDVLRAILALPPPPRATDAGDGGALLVLSLVRAWASSRAALLATIRRRRRTLIAIEQCHEEGRTPTRQELRSWQGSSDVQLGFAALLADARVAPDVASQIRQALDAERNALESLFSLLNEHADPDVARVTALRQVRSDHPTASILAFSESASTVRAYYDAMRGDAGVGMLTARGGRIATGRIARSELLALFAPRAQGVRAPAEHQRVTLLISTDLLSEGVNLQDASVVVNLDLPWNPARLAQRLGRVRRPGGAECVYSYVMAPPADAALLLMAESRLRAKLAHMERTIGRGLDVLPALAPRNADIVPRDPFPTVELSDAELRGEIEDRLLSWRQVARTGRAGRVDRCVVAATLSDEYGWIASLDDGRLLACIERVSDDSRTIARAIALSGGEPRMARPRESATALQELSTYIDHEWSIYSCGIAHASPQIRRAIRRRLDEAARTAPRHRRATVLAAATKLRTLLERPMTLGIERAFAELALSSDRNALDITPPQARARTTEWIFTALAHLDGGTPPAPTERRVRPRPVALILFGPDT